jgi:hypothetical protein
MNKKISIATPETDPLRFTQDIMLSSDRLLGFLDDR